MSKQAVEQYLRNELNIEDLGDDDVQTIVDASDDPARVDFLLRDMGMEDFGSDDVQALVAAAKKTNIMNLRINISGTEGAPASFVQQLDAMLASLNGVNDWSITTDDSVWVWTEDGGHWEKV